MIDIDAYLRCIIGLLQDAFGTRLLYVGLQGSYLRGEAHENSDIDVMVVLDRLTVEDMMRYRTVIASAGQQDRACGFICGREELAHWNPCEICHLLHTTHDCYGELAPLVPSYTQEDVRTFVKLSVGNLYHMLCHTYVHAGDAACAQLLPDAWKQVFFILQNVTFLKNGRFYQNRRELLTALSGADCEVLQKAMEPSGAEEPFEARFQQLFDWCQQTLHAL